MSYEEWLASVPSELTKDALWRMEVYQLAVFAGDLAWRDVTKGWQKNKPLITKT
jgi:hypothetical protein